jgi:hypothetical protein
MPRLLALFHWGDRCSLRQHNVKTFYRPDNPSTKFGSTLYPRSQCLSDTVAASGQETGRHQLRFEIIDSIS